MPEHVLKDRMLLIRGLSMLRARAFAGPGHVGAQNYPAKPVRMRYVLIDGKFDPALAGVA